ncbi:MAG: ABC transporter ATP-binding protein [Calditrichia bacterium]
MPVINENTVLRVEQLSLDVLTENGRHPLVRDISFELPKGKVLGIVGESGSGKTVTCLSLTKLLPQPPIMYQQGKVLFRKQDLWELPADKLRRVRGEGIGFIFQEAFSALNPVLPVGKQVAEVFRYHMGHNVKKAEEETLQLFRQVGIPSPEVRYSHFPHQLSGGLQQRVMIAMALAGNPEILIADEPTTALDVTIQVQIITLLKRLQQERRMAVIFVSHDLGLIAEICDEVLVMYAGEMVEKASASRIFSHPVHPYTQLLLKTAPRLNARRGELTVIPGQVPSPAHYPAGCKFHPRCPLATEECKAESPPLFQVSGNHLHRCLHPAELK